MGKISLTPEQKQALEATGYLSTGMTGGLPLITYYTPDGRRIRAIPALREYVRKDAQGKVIGQGTRDANLDKGWLLAPLATPKPHCPACDNWHDTRADVAKCMRKQKAFIKAAQQRAEAEEAQLRAKAEAKNTDLEREVAELKAMVAKLLGGLNGDILQSKGTQPGGQDAGRNGKAKKGVQ